MILFDFCWSESVTPSSTMNCSGDGAAGYLLSSKKINERCPENCLPPCLSAILHTVLYTSQSRPVAFFRVIRYSSIFFPFFFIAIAFVEESGYVRKDGDSNGPNAWAWISSLPPSSVATRLQRFQSDIKDFCAREERKNLEISTVPTGCRGRTDDTLFFCTWKSVLHCRNSHRDQMAKVPLRSVRRLSRTRLCHAPFSDAVWIYLISQTL